MIWYKYKHRYAYGEDREWTYVYFRNSVSKQELKQFLEDRMNEHSWSDKYRGITYFKVSKLSEKQKQEQILRLKDRIKWKKEYLKGLEEDLIKIQNEDSSSK